MNIPTQPASSPRPPAPAKAGAGAEVAVDVDEAEAALVEHYPRLVRLAYLTLPTALGKHRRVLAAHRIAQGALPRAPRTAPGGAYPLLRREVLGEALGYGRRDGGVRARVRQALRAVRPPAVLGLRLHPRAGGSDELALERALSGLAPQARAAYALRVLDGLGEAEARAVLAAAGAPDPRGALRAAAALGAGRPPGAAEFDPCTLQARPTDLLSRRRRGRVALAAGAVIGAGALLLAVDAAGGAVPAPAGAAGADPHALDPAALVRAAAGTWRSTARLDFTAWPARGDRTGDLALLRRALAAWAAPGPRVSVTATPGTPRSGPGQPPQLLFAGDVDGAAVVLLHDGLRIVRYAEPRAGGSVAALDFARADAADPATAAAVVVDRVDGNSRYLTAPWITQAGTRDLLAPGRAAAPLHRAPDGVTDPVRTPAARPGACGSRGTTWPALELRSSDAALGRSGVLLTDLGDLVPAHLTYTPPPSYGPAGPPREATGPMALASWAHGACRLGELRGQGVKSVDAWEFARTRLPQHAGEAAWTCERADTWRGPGLAAVVFRPPGGGPDAPGSVIATQSDGRACSRYGQDVLAGVMWRSPAGTWYLLAAGSRTVTGITAAHGVTGASTGPYLAVPAPRGTRPTLVAHLPDGTTIHPLGEN